jgi:hypothetical protein
MRILTIILIIKLIFLSSCGYRVINKISDYNFKINNTEFSGNDKINRNFEKFFLRLGYEENPEKYYDINFKSNLIKKTTSKNTAGEDSSYSIKIEAKMDILENGEIIDNIKFNKSISYNNLSSKFELKQYENVLIKDLSDQIIIEINSYFETLR